MLIELWMHLGSLESTQEPRVARGDTLTHLSCSPNFPRASITQYTHAEHEQILNEYCGTLSNGFVLNYRMDIKVNDRMDLN